MCQDHFSQTPAVNAGVKWSEKGFKKTKFVDQNYLKFVLAELGCTVLSPPQCPVGGVFQYRVGSGIGHDTVQRVGFGSS